MGFFVRMGNKNKANNVYVWYFAAGMVLQKHKPFYELWNKKCFTSQSQGHGRAEPGLTDGGIFSMT